MKAIVTEIGAPVLGSDCEVNRGHAAQAAKRAVILPDHRAQVAVLEVVGLEDLDARLGDLLTGKGERKVADMGAVLESSEVVVQPENGSGVLFALDSGRIGANALEDAHPVMERVREHADACFLERDELAIDPDAGHGLVREKGKPHSIQNDGVTCQTALLPF